MQEIKATIKNDFDIELFWKSDFLSEQETRQLSLLDLSLFDFEMAITARMFVGTTRSTFSNMVALEKYARTGVSVDTTISTNIRRPGTRASPRQRRVFGPVAGVRVRPLGCRSRLSPGAYLPIGRRVGASAGAIRRPRGLHGGRTRTSVTRAFTGSLRSRPNSGIRRRTCLPHMIAPRRSCRGARRRGTAQVDMRGSTRCTKRAHDFAKQALASTAPEDGHFVERWIYDWALLDEYAVSASWIGLYRQSLDACLDLLERDVVPSDDRGRIAGNAKFCLDRLLHSLASGNQL